VLKPGTPGADMTPRGDGDAQRNGLRPADGPVHPGFLPPRGL